MKWHGRGECPAGIGGEGYEGRALSIPGDAEDTEDISTNAHPRCGFLHARAIKRSGRGLHSDLSPQGDMSRLIDCSRLTSRTGAPWPACLCPQPKNGMVTRKTNAIRVKLTTDLFSH